MDPPLFIQLYKTVIHGTHLVLGGGSNDTFNLMQFIVTDHITDRRCKAHNFKHRNNLSVYIRNQLLGNDCLQNHGKLYDDLMLLRRFKNIYDTADGVCGTERMQAGKHKMTGLGSGHCRLDRFMIPHFTQ